MNKAQYKKACAVVNADATGEGLLFDPDTGAYCALGGLLHAAGVPNASLRQSDFDICIEGEELTTTYAVYLPDMRKAYGITTARQLNSIWRTNDRHETVEQRRKALKALFAKWVK